VQIGVQAGSSPLVLALAAEVSRAVTAQGEIEMAMQRVIGGIVVLGIAAFALFFYLRGMKTQRQVVQSAFARAFCFFCSQPLEMDERFSAGLPLGGRAREVSACRRHAEQLSGGGQPEVAAVNHEGRLIPWFAAPGYDPRLDYRATGTATLPLSTVTAEFATSAVAQSSTPLAMADARSSTDWWRSDPVDPSPANTQATSPDPASLDSKDVPTNRASQAP
jgi:hypothetical protein